MKFTHLVGLAHATAIALPAAASAADAPAAFAACKACHKTVAGGKGMGPSLFGVVGRKPGTEAGFNYSPAMKAFGEKNTWDAALLAKYVDNPKAVVPGNRMPFGGLHDAAKAKEVADYLATLK